MFKIYLTKSSLLWIPWLLGVPWLSIAWLWWLSIPSPRSTIWITHYYSEEKKVIYCHYFLFCSHWISGLGLVLWCLIPLSTIFQLYKCIVMVSFIGGGNQRTQKHRPPASHWQNLSHNVVSSTPRYDRYSQFSLEMIFDITGHNSYKFFGEGTAIVVINFRKRT
jgi:hypothetical protein